MGVPVQDSDREILSSPPPKKHNEFADTYEQLPLKKKTKDWVTPGIRLTREGPHYESR